VEVTEGPRWREVEGKEVDERGRERKEFKSPTDKGKEEEEVEVEVMERKR